jgi:hypothetical protein
MGGFAAFTRQKFDELNGYEERMEIWGGEDNDFANRFRRAGYPIRWMSSRETRIFHIWHQPSQSKASETEEGRLAIERNRQIIRGDVSFIRNPSRRRPQNVGRPPVTVVVPTYRRAAMLPACLESIRRQTWKNFEVLVVENGDSDEAEPVVASLNDPRFRYQKIVEKGAAAARNFAIDQASGRFIVVHDDDDLMVSTRLEDHLRALGAGKNGTYGGWIDFDHSTGGVLERNTGKEFSFEALLCNGKVMTHGALMLDRRVFRMFRYEEELAAGIDYGFLLTLARNGLTLAHTGSFAILRRMHRSNMTTVNKLEQKAAALQTIDVIRGEIDPQDYGDIRARGLAAKCLGCRNQLAAETELLGWYPLASVQGRLHFGSLDEIDVWLDHHSNADLEALLGVATRGVAALVRSRLEQRRRRAWRAEP